MKRDEKKMIHRALDGEVTRVETRMLRKRLEADRLVRQEFKALKQVVQESGKIRIDVPQDFTRKVLRGVEDTTRRRKKGVLPD